MYCYAQLTQYFHTYKKSLPGENRINQEFDIGNCGDERICELLLPQLDFGKLEMETKPCDEETAYDISVLLRLLSGMYRVKVVPTLTSLLLDPKPKIEYSSLWILFRPGTFVYAKQANLLQASKKRGSRSSKNQGENKEYVACVVVAWRYQDKEVTSKDKFRQLDRFEMELWNIEYDGNTFQRMAYDTVITKFDGFKHLQDLSIVPSQYYDKFDKGILRQRLEQRGRKYLSIVKESAAFRTYRNRRSGYEGQVIVDPESYRHYEKFDHYAENEDDFNFAEEMYNTLNQLELQTTGQGAVRVEYTTPMTGGAVLDGGRKFDELTTFEPHNSESFARRNELCLLLPPTVQGFGLDNKSWMVFEVEDLSDEPPKSSQNQLDTELVLVSDADKEALRTVLPRGKTAIASPSDFVDGKGEGKVFLLYGGPGTGKTLTVECLANDTERPLLRLTAQDVGLASQSESHLRKWFALAARWHAILLIDEADLFLEQRKEGDIQWNSLSTVFLRTMEYYKGILFLTTNRPGHIDDSFISRITCPIEYPELSLQTKEMIIERFVTRFEETNSISVAPEAIRHLVEHCQDLNGRQIRNVLQNAVAYAENKPRVENRSSSAKPAHQQGSSSQVVTVNLRHVKAAVERQLGFQRYLKKLRGRDEKARALNRHDFLTSRSSGHASA
jgi:hypothetical protein